MQSLNQLTRIGNENAARMSAKTMLKGFIANSISSIPIDIYYGMKTSDMYQNMSNKTVQLLDSPSFSHDFCVD